MASSASGSRPPRSPLASLSSPSNSPVRHTRPAKARPAVSSEGGGGLPTNDGLSSPARQQPALPTEDDAARSGESNHPRDVGSPWGNGKQCNALPLRRRLSLGPTRAGSSSSSASASLSAKRGTATPRCQSTAEPSGRRSTTRPTKRCRSRSPATSPDPSDVSSPTSNGGIPTTPRRSSAATPGKSAENGDDKENTPVGAARRKHGRRTHFSSAERSSAGKDDGADVDANALLLQPHDLQRSIGKAEYMLNNTKEKLAKDGRGPVGPAEKKVEAANTQDALLFVRLMHPIIVRVYCIHNGKFLLRKLEGLLATQRGQYRKWWPRINTCLEKAFDTNDWKTGCTNSKQKGLIGRVEPQVKAEHPDKSAEEIGNIIDKTCSVYFTLDESLGIVNERPELEAIARKIQQRSPAFQVHDDHRIDAYGEVVNFLMELTLAATFPGTPGYVGEKILNFGSDLVRQVCELPGREENEDAISALKGTGGARSLFTWSPTKSDVYRYLQTQVSDAATRIAVDAMLRAWSADGFLQNHETLRMFAYSDILQPFVNAVPTSAAFDAFEEAALRIADAIETCVDAEASQRVIQEAIRSLSDYTEMYVVPSDEVYSEGAISGLEKVLSAAIASKCSKALILIEKDLKKRLDSATISEYFPENCAIPIVNRNGETAAELWELDQNIGIPCGKTINVLVVPSVHCILGENNTYHQRMKTCSAYLAIMSVLEYANIIPTGSTEIEQSIKRAFFIECQGYSGGFEVDGDGDFGNFHKARQLATQKGFFINPIKAGVRAIGNAISSHHGIDDLFVPGLMGALEYHGFSQMMKIGFDIDVGPVEDAATFLSRFPAIISERIKAIESKPEPDRNEWERKLLKKHEAEREKKNAKRRERDAETKEEVANIKAKAEVDRKEWESKLLEKHEAEREKKNAKRRERDAETREEVANIKAKAEVDRKEWESKLLEKYEAERRKKSERDKDHHKEYYAENKEQICEQGRKRYAAKKKNILNKYRYFRVTVPPGRLGIKLTGNKISQVAPECPVRQMVRTGDFIVSVNGKAVKLPNDLAAGKECARTFEVARKFRENSYADWMDQLGLSAGVERAHK